MLPVFALGPSLCAGMGLAPVVVGPFLVVPSCETVPSGLSNQLVSDLEGTKRDDIVLSRQKYECTDNLGFFFGPGRPRSLMGPFGSIEGGARLRPVTALPPRLRLSTLGGASELPSVVSAVGGTGVALDSDDLSLTSGGGADGEGSTVLGITAGLVETMSDGKVDS